MGDHGIFEPLFDPEVSGDEVIDRMENESQESVERHLRRASAPHKLLVERVVDEWPETVEWIQAHARERARVHAASALRNVEDRMLKVVGKVIDATHKAQLDRRAAATRMGHKEYGRPAVHVIGKYVNPIFRKIGQWRANLVAIDG